MLFYCIYNILFPVVFLFFLPGLIIKLIRRPGEKSNYPERFGIFTKDKSARLAGMKGCIWMHAVSVGETNLALTFLQTWLKQDPHRKFVLSTTTTTAQEIAKKRAPTGVEVIFCPIDFLPFVRKAYRLFKPSGLVIFETEIWPNLLGEAKRRGLPTALVNGRMSDHSVKGYRRFRFIFGTILRKFDVVCVQTEVDRERYLSVAPELTDRIAVCGNIKFDQRRPENLKMPDLKAVFGENSGPVILGASTHSGEEAMIADAFLKVKEKIPAVRLIIVPRHAERGAELFDMLKNKIPGTFRRSTGGTIPADTECLLADTTGELLGFIASSDIVIMGKTLAGNNEGQNIIEPAVFGRAIVCGPELRNFREAQAVLEKADAIIKVNSTDELSSALIRLSEDDSYRKEFGERAETAISAHRGAVAANMKKLEKVF